MTNTKTMTDNQFKLRAHILQSCIERMDSIQLKGKRRDDEVITYLCGATKVLELLDNELANNMKCILLMILCVRPSYNECKRMLEEYHTQAERAA